MHNARITLAALLLAVLLLPLAAVGTAASALGATVRPAAPFPLVVHSADGAVTIAQRSGMTLVGRAVSGTPHLHTSR